MKVGSFVAQSTDCLDVISMVSVRNQKDYSLVSCI